MLELLDHRTIPNAGFRLGARADALSSQACARGLGPGRTRPIDLAILVVSAADGPDDHRRTHLPIEREASSAATHTIA